MKIRIATWNMAYWSHKKYFEEAWAYFLNELDVDIFLFQEAKPCKMLCDDKSFIWHNAGESSGKKEWGAGIYSKKFELSKEPEESIPDYNRQKFEEQCVIASSKINGNILTLISLYGLLETIGTEPSYSIPNLHRIFSDLTGILNGRMNGKRTIILGGDLNAGIQFDEKFGGSSHKIFFERVKDFKLENCFELKGNKDFVQTLRHISSKIPWQNDYFFISKSISKKLVDCEVIDNDLVRKYSDHNPVIITLNL
ncbi:MAG: hypothetical protein Q7S21_00335 [archaeon]|nr:hypothetical protein [archaeon]